jgi:hypothetical protein
MKNIILFLLFSFQVFSQNLHHQMISSQGKTNILSNGMLVSQTIGQQSAVGNYQNGKVTFGQGFQQSNWNKILRSNTYENISTVTYPNPFIEIINFQFSKPITDQIQISVFDINGRMIFQTEKKSFDSLLSISLPQLASSNYLIRLTATNFTYYSQILKK